jgi:hypothetical protein
MSGKERMAALIGKTVKSFSKQKESSTCIPLSWEKCSPESNQQLKAKESRTSMRQRTSADPSPNCMTPSTGAQQQEVRISTRMRRPPVKLSKDFL